MKPSNIPVVFLCLAASLFDSSCYRHEPTASEPSTLTSVLAKEMERAFAWYDHLGIEALLREEAASAEAEEKAAHAPVEKVKVSAGDEKAEWSFSFSFFGPPSGLSELAARLHFIENPDSLRKTAAETVRGIHGRLESAHFVSFDAETRLKAFILSRHCARIGERKLSNDLFVLAATMNTRESAEEREFAAILEKEFAEALIWRMILAFGDVSVGRPTLKRWFEWFASKFGKTEFGDRARKTAEILKRMVDEDREHENLKTPFANLPRDDQIRELIFQLRDQTGQQTSWPGSCGILRDGGFSFPGAALQEGTTPAHRLLAFGNDAVPLLIEALDDDSFTRALGFCRPWFFSHVVLRVGDCALRLIQRLTGWTFYQRRSTSGEMVPDGDAPTVKKKVREWWEAYQVKGRRRMLIEAVEKGDYDGYLLAYELVKNHPDAALAALTKAVENCSWNDYRSYFVSWIADLPGNDQTPFLEKELETGPTLACRLHAASGLLSRGHPSAFPFLEKQWLDLKTRENTDWHDVEILVRILVFCRRPAGLKLLRKDLGQYRDDVRYKVVDAFQYGNREYYIESKEKGEKCSPDDKCAILEEIEGLLVDLLNDRSATRCSMGLPGGGSVEPRICDLAARAISSIWSEKYAFDVGLSEAERDGMIRAILERHGRDG